MTLRRELEQVYEYFGTDQGSIHMSTGTVPSSVLSPIEVRFRDYAIALSKVFHLLRHTRKTRLIG